MGMDYLSRYFGPANVVGLLRATSEDFEMSIEHKLEPIEHWIVDGKAYRLATEADVGKEVYRTDIDDGVREAINPISGTVPLTAYEPENEKPYVCACRWKYAYVQDDSLLTPQPTPVSVSSVPKEIQSKDTHDTPKPIDWTKPVRTKDGRAVRVLCTDGPGYYPVAGYIEGDIEPQTWALDGEFLLGGTGHLNLENIPQRIKREYWVNVYKNTKIPYVHFTKQDADNEAGERFACVKITIDCDEGEGL